MPWKLMPSVALRENVMVVLRESRSTWPDCRIAQHGCGQRPAIIDVDAAPLALVVGEGEARQAEMHAAFEVAARLDGVERRARRELLGGGAGDAERERGRGKNS